MIPITIVISDERLARRLGLKPWMESDPAKPSFLAYADGKPYLWPLDPHLWREIQKKGNR